MRRVDERWQPGNEILPTGGFGARYNEAKLPTWH